MQKFIIDGSKENAYIKYERARLLSEPLTICTVDQLFKFVYKALGTEIFAATLKYSKVVLDEIQSYSPGLIAALIYGLKMITDMERIGDQAADIADIVKVTSLGVPDASIRLKDMAKATASMVTKCIDAYVKQDLKLAREVIDSDDIVDDLFDEVKDEILQGMRKGITTDVQSLDYLMIAKYYERIGDHATNIAEWVVYSINGHHKGE